MTRPLMPRMAAASASRAARAARICRAHCRLPAVISCATGEPQPWPHATAALRGPVRHGRCQLGVFGGEPYPHKLCLPGNHLADAQVDGEPVGDGQAIYISKAAYVRLPGWPVIPPALRGAADYRPPGLDAQPAEVVWVVLALDPQQQEVLRRGEAGTGIINRAVVHLLYQDGTVISHFGDSKARGRWRRP